MSGYITAEQHAQLLGAINPNRVGKDGKGFSHVEAYEIRAHLTRIFGFARWSGDLTDLTPIYESEKDGKHTVCYRATVRLTICAPDGTVLATYTEAATGEAKNQPHRGDAHDLAIKTAESQALKRCAVNLGDAYGLSLYRKGSLAPLVKATLVPAAGAVRIAGSAATSPTEPATPAPPVDAHITEPLPQESEQVEDQRETNPRKATPPAPATVAKDQLIAAFRDRLLAGPGDKAAAPFYAAMHLEATKAGILTALVENRDDEVVSVGAFLESERKAQRSAA